MVSNNTISSTSILLDYGVTLYMFTSWEHFTTYIEFSNKFVIVDSHNYVSISGQGLVLFLTKLLDSRLNITLYDVLYIPHLGVNLVSLGTLHRQGVSVKSFDNELILSKDNEKLFRASLIDLTGTLYHIQCIALVTGTAYLASGLLSMCLWYQYIGHLSSYAINSMKCQNLVNSLEISISREFDYICSGCVNAKSYHFPFSEFSNTHYSKMKLVVMDLTGPMLVLI